MFSFWGKEGEKDKNITKMENKLWPINFDKCAKMI